MDPRSVQSFATQVNRSLKSESMQSISVIIETPAGSNQKFTFDSVEGRMKLNKILPSGMVFPFDFGFIPGTKGGDGDPLDVMVISETGTFPGCLVECRIIGAFVVQQSQIENSSKMIRNDRLIAVPVQSVLYEHISSMGDLPKKFIAQLEAFFVNYIEQEGKNIKIEKRISATQALKLIRQCEDSLDRRLLFEIFLPLKNNEGTNFPARLYQELRELLVEKFGGITIYKRSKAIGIWENDEGSHEKDELLIYEVMVSRGDETFWKELKIKLEKQFEQESILIRSFQLNTL